MIAVCAHVLSSITGCYLVKSVLRHRYRQGWRFLTLWEGCGVEEATWEPFSAFVLPEGRLNSVLVDYLSQNNLGELLRLAETLASKTKGGLNLTLPLSVLRMSVSVSLLSGAWLPETGLR